MAVEDLNLSIGKINVDKVYFDIDTSELVFTDMAIQRKSEQRNYLRNKDLNDIGNLLVQVLTKHCKLELYGDLDDTTIKIFKKVHAIPHYNYSDEDVGVPLSLNLI